MNIFFQLALSLLVLSAWLSGCTYVAKPPYNTLTVRTVRALLWTLLALGALTWIWQ